MDVSGEAGGLGRPVIWMTKCYLLGRRFSFSFQPQVGCNDTISLPSEVFPPSPVFLHSLAHSFSLRVLIVISLFFLASQLTDSLALQFSF